MSSLILESLYAKTGICLCTRRQSNIVIQRDCTDLQFWLMGQNFVSVVYSVQLLSVYTKHLIMVWSVQFVNFFSVCHGSLSIDKPRMASVYSVKTAESYQISLGTISPKTSYGPGIFRQDYGIRRGSPMNHTRLPLAHHLRSSFTGTDQTGRPIISSAPDKKG